MRKIFIFLFAISITHNIYAEITCSAPEKINIEGQCINKNQVLIKTVDIDTNQPIENIRCYLETADDSGNTLRNTDQNGYIIFFITQDSSLSCDANGWHTDVELLTTADCGKLKTIFMTPAYRPINNTPTTKEGKTKCVHPYKGYYNGTCLNALTVNGIVEDDTGKRLYGAKCKVLDFLVDPNGNHANDPQLNKYTGQTDTATENEAVIQIQVPYSNKDLGLVVECNYPRYKPQQRIFSHKNWNSSWIEFAMQKKGIKSKTKKQKNTNAKQSPETKAMWDDLYILESAL